MGMITQLGLTDYVSRRLDLKRDGPRFKAHCPFHDDPNPSFTLYPDRNNWWCFGCQRGGDLPDYVGHELFNGSWDPHDGEKFRAAVETLERQTETLSPAPAVAFSTVRRQEAGRRTFDYCLPDGSLAYQVVRTDYADGSKVIKQRRPDGNGGWTWSLSGVTRLPYRLPELLAAPTWETVYVPEGEQCVETLRGLGEVATCNSEGAENWRPELNEYLRNRIVVILPDNDDPGRRHAEIVARNLQDIARRVKVLEL